VSGLKVAQKLEISLFRPVLSDQMVLGALMTSRGKSWGMEAVARSREAESLYKVELRFTNLQLWRFSFIINFNFHFITFNQS
jgi:hypothetical protein